MNPQPSPQAPRVEFFSLDRVIRDIIYNMVLNSGNYTECLLLSCSRDHDHQLNYLNSTNILMVCRQIYREAVGLLHKKEVIVKVPEPTQGHTTWGSTGTMFRHPKAFGKPKVFAESRSPYKRWLPFEMSELEFVRLRKLSLVIPLPLEKQTVREPRKVWTGQELRQYHRKLKDIASALAKCTHLEIVRLLLDRNRYDDLSRGEMKKIMRKDRFYGTAKLLMNIVRAADSTDA